MPRAADLAFLRALGRSALGRRSGRHAPSLFRAAFSLSAALAATAGFICCAAPLLAAVQILLYTGGVLTLVVFALVIAGANTKSGGGGSRARGGLCLGRVRRAGGIAAPPSGRGRRQPREREDDGLLLFRDYLVPFELLSGAARARSSGAPDRRRIAPHDTLEPAARRRGWSFHRAFRRPRPPPRDRRLPPIELMFNAVNLAVVALAWSRGLLAGVVLVLFGIAITVAEIAVGLALVLLASRTRDSVTLDDLLGLSG